MTIRKAIFSCLCAAIIFSGCSHVMPSKHLPMHVMEDIIYDISYAEAYSTKSADNVNFGGIKNIDSLAIYYKDILSHYRISKEEFEESLAWYKARPSDMDSIYTHITVRADKANAEESKKKKLQQPAPLQLSAPDTTHLYPGQRRNFPQSLRNKPS